MFLHSNCDCFAHACASRVLVFFLHSRIGWREWWEGSHRRASGGCGQRKGHTRGHEAIRLHLLWLNTRCAHSPTHWPNPSRMPVHMCVRVSVCLHARVTSRILPIIQPVPLQSVSLCLLRHLPSLVIDVPHLHAQFALDCSLPVTDLSAPVARCVYFCYLLRGARCARREQAHCVLF